MIEFSKSDSKGRNHVYVKSNCDCCKEEFDVRKNNYNKAIKKNNGYWFCKRCAIQKRNEKYTSYKNTPIHNSFAAAKSRCRYIHHTSYKYYGGRGIEFKWDDFKSFHGDMSDTWFEGATLDRIDFNGHYEKKNCRWITKTEQARNTSRNIHSKDDILKIRKMHEEGCSQTEIANIFNDSQGNISNIILKRTWKDI